ncbi:MAG: class I SAM-dependent methyltransferase [Actinomycetota bacterium]|nr:class I SAM-dependent methyltransferase [Actinomycetota bacterium]
MRFEVRDVELTDFDGEQFDYAFSRFGTMFFANPVAALRNVRRALAPRGYLCMVVWRRKLDNDCVHCAENVVKAMVQTPEDSDEPTCGPGPFSMADADTTSQIVQGAEAEHLLPDVVAALHEALAQFAGADGVIAPASTWTIAARAPA